jgi:hypothetical protein
MCVILMGKLIPSRDVSSSLADLTFRPGRYYDTIGARP